MILVLFENNKVLPFVLISRKSPNQSATWSLDGRVTNSQG